MLLDHTKQHITVVSRASGHLDLFAIGNDDRPVTTFWSATDGWRGEWMTLPGNTLIDHRTQQITAIARQPGVLDLFAIDNQGRPITTFWSAASGSADNPTGWRGDWMALPGNTFLDHTTQRITAVARKPGNLDLFAIGNDDRPITTFWTATDGWRGDWMTLPGNTLIDHRTQQITAVARKPGNLDLFAIGNDDRPITTFWTATDGWRGDWMTLPGSPFIDRRTQRISAVARKPGNLDLFVINNNDRVISTFWNATDGWRADWVTLPSTLGGDTTLVLDHTVQQLTVLVSKPSGIMFITAVAPDGRQLGNGWSPRGGWGPCWGAVPGTVRLDHRTQQLAAVSRKPFLLDFFAVGDDDKPISIAFSGAGETGWSSDWFALPSH
ncbi:hypothetical protein [Nocardia sp. CA-145437]|uniref:hypothetical protein n=1 Tax=Nocardia sp. CA-145437 TaxID=3239980 RepID=UPI003D972AC5